MAIRSQFRLNQMTASFGAALGKVNDSLTNKAALASIAVSDLSGSLSYLASAVRRVHGGADFSNQVAGTFSQNLIIDKAAGSSLTIGAGAATDSQLNFDGNAQDFHIGLDDTDDKLKIGVGTTVGTTPNMVLFSASRNVEFYGDIDVASDITCVDDNPRAIFANVTSAIITMGGGGLLNAAGDIKVTGNNIQNSGGANALRFDADATNVAVTLANGSGLTTTAADLKVGGNDIQDGGGNTQVTFTNASRATFGYDLWTQGDIVVNGGDLLVKGVNDAVATLTLAADNSDDNGDDWRMEAKTDQTMELQNNINGSYISHLSIIPNATVANSVTDVKGILRLGANGSVQNASQGQGILLGGDVDNVTVELGKGTGLTTTVADLKVGGNDILDSGGNIHMTMTAGAGGLTAFGGDLQLAGVAIDVDAASALTIGASVGANDLTLGGSTSTVVIPGNLTVDGTKTILNVNEIAVEDKAIAMGIPGGMVSATYTISSNVVTVASTGHGLLNSEFVLISDPADAAVITEAVYQITSVADVNTFTFAFTAANQASATAITHSKNNVTNATADNSGILVSPASTVEHSIKWKTTGWTVSGNALSGSWSPATDNTADLGLVAAQWKDLYVNGIGYIDQLGTDGDPTTAYIGGGEIDGTVIGSEAVAAGSFAALVATTGVFSGILKTDDATEATTTTDGSLQTDGGLSVAKSAVVGDDLDLLSDSAILNFGADKDVSLTHSNDVGLTLNGAMKLMFNDASQFIHASSNEILELGATAEIGLTATLVDMDANLDLDGTANVSGLTTLQTGLVPDADDGAYLGTGALGWSDLFLAEGGVINWDNGDLTLTQADNLLTVAGGELRMDAAQKVEFGGNSNWIQLDTDLKIIASADILMDAAGSDIKMQSVGTNPFQQLNRAGAGVSYINFSVNDGAGMTGGSGGFGFRNNAGAMQFKNDGGSWTSFSGDEVTESKTVKAVTATIASGARVFGTGNGFDVSDVTASTNDRVDIFVNGQLMVSSSLVTGNGDYALDAADGQADCDIQMQFALEADDVVSVIVR